MMAARCVWIIFIVLMMQTIQKSSAVKLLVLRENADSRSQEETSDSLTSEESEELDFLMDLLDKEARDREQPPVTTVKVIKRKPDGELFAQHSVRKEKIESKPKAFKEYHIHYHNHQHKEPPKLHMGLEGDTMRPILWDSQLPLTDYDSFNQLKKSASMPYSEKARVKSFRDFETFLKSNLRSSLPSKEYDSAMRYEAFKDFDSFIKPKLASLKSQERTPYERFKTFQDFMDSEEEDNGKESGESDKSEFPNKDRFAGFKDFSEIEDPNPKTQTQEKDSSESDDEKENLKVKDFAIVIKSKPRPMLKHTENTANKFVNKNKNERPTPQTPPFVNNLRVPNNKYFGLPRVLDAAGGAPKYVERLNQMRRPIPQKMPYKNHVDFNALANNQKQFFQLRPFPVHLIPNLSFNGPINGWLLRRLV